MAERPTVYYDGGCPVCRREIGFYQRRAGGESLHWVDVTQADEAALGPGLSREAALARIHVRRADGSVVDRAAAFAEIWRGMPGLRWLGLVLAVIALQPRRSRPPRHRPMAAIGACPEFSGIKDFRGRQLDCTMRDTASY